MDKEKLTFLVLLALFLLMVYFMVVQPLMRGESITFEFREVVRGLWP